MKHQTREGVPVEDAVTALQQSLSAMSPSVERQMETPRVGHELFKPGILTGKVPQFELLAAGNPKPPTVAISPLYQITVDDRLRANTLREDAA